MTITNIVKNQRTISFVISVLVVTFISFFSTNVFGAEVTTDDSMNNALLTEYEKKDKPAENQNSKTISADEILHNEQWARSVFGGDGALPFSFVYNGEHSSKFINTWEKQIKDKVIDNTKSQRLLILTDPKTKLEVCAEVTIYQDSAGIDWTLYFTNKGEADTPIIEQVKALDIRIDPKKRMDNYQIGILHSMTGSTACGKWSLDDWNPVVKPLRGAHASKVEFFTEDAKPAYGASPFFNLQWGDSGVITAVGWTGHWGGSVDYEVLKNKLAMEAGMRGIHLKLYPGEKIRSPRILQVYWHGTDVEKSYNLFRQTMFKHIMPRIKDEIAVPPIAHTGSAFREYGKTTEAIEIDYLEHMKGLGFEYYWLDAWWQKDHHPNGIGNYGFPIEKCPDPVRFPNGLRPLSDAVHDVNMKFILWFGNESVYPNTFLRQEFPEWMLTTPGNGHATFDITIPEARKYIFNYLNTVIKEYRIDCYRNDSGPIYTYFQYEDSKQPDRQGMKEIRYVEAFYQLWDDLREANPDLLIDNCCGGGTRIDLETSARSIVLWRTDGTQFPIWTNDYQMCAVQNQAMTASLNRYIPFHTSGQMGTGDLYMFRSAFNGGISVCDDIRTKDFPREEFKKSVTEAKRIRKYLFGNFYPMVGMDIDPKNWCVMQYHLPEENEGLVRAFRRHESPHDSYICDLREIDDDKVYQVYISPIAVQGKPVKMKGSELKKLRISIGERPGSVIVEYKALK